MLTCSAYISKIFTNFQAPSLPSAHRMEASNAVPNPCFATLWRSYFGCLEAKWRRNRCRRGWYQSCVEDESWDHLRSQPVCTLAQRKGKLTARSENRNCNSCDVLGFVIIIMINTINIILSACYYLYHMICNKGVMKRIEFFSVISLACSKQQMK